VKKALTIGLAGVALAAMLSLVGAGSREAEREHVAAAGPQPDFDIRTLLSEIGLSAIGEPVRRGHYYVLHAYDPRGVELRVVADAQFGDIIAVTPVRPLPLQFQGGPRIIHVPQPDERGDDVDAYGPPDVSAAPEADGGDEYEQAAPPPRLHPAAKPRPRSDNPPATSRKLGAVASPPTPERAVLTAPPPSADRSLTPVYPTPRFKAPADSGDKFAPPDEAAVAPGAPPPPVTAVPAATEAPLPASAPDDSL